MIAYRTLPGILLCRKYTISENSGSLEILSLHLIFSKIDYKCMHLKFSIFDYASRKFTFNGVYDKMDKIKEFNVFTLADLAKASM